MKGENNEEKEMKIIFTIKRLFIYFYFFFCLNPDSLKKLIETSFGILNN